MKHEVQESLEKIRESFRTIKSTAKEASLKFQDEGKPFMDSRSNVSNKHLRNYLKAACSFFPRLVEKYSNESVIDNVIVDAKTEKDKARSDYYIGMLRDYSKLDNIAVSVLENKPIAHNYTNPAFNDNPDESAIKTVNDQVRLLHTDAYNEYIQAKENKEQNRKLAQNPPKKPDDYSWTQAQIEDKARKVFSTTKAANELINLENEKKNFEIQKLRNQKQNEETNSSKKKVFPKSKTVSGVITGVLSIFATLLVVIALSAQFVYINFILEAHQFAFSDIIMVVLVLAVLAVGAAIAFFVSSIVFGLVLSILTFIFSPFALIFKASSRNTAKDEIDEEASFEQYYTSKKSVLQSEYNKKCNEYVKSALDSWNDRKEKYDADYARYVRACQISRKDIPEEIKNNYYREIARIAATSKPILTSTLKHIQTIKESVDIIAKEYTKLCGYFKVMCNSEDAIKCYDLLNNGEVDTYEQARDMLSILAKADAERMNRKKAQERKDAEERSKKLEEERLEREREWEREQERREEERKKREKEEQRLREDEMIRKIEKLIEKQNDATQEQTNAILHSAIATVKSINEQNERIEEQNKILEKIERGY